MVVARRSCLCADAAASLSMDSVTPQCSKHHGDDVVHGVACEGARRLRRGIKNNRAGEHVVRALHAAVHEAAAGCLVHVAQSRSSKDDRNHLSIYGQRHPTRLARM